MKLHGEQLQTLLLFYLLEWGSHVTKRGELKKENFSSKEEIQGRNTVL